MNTSNQVMAWGEEITPLEMENTKGGIGLTELAALMAGLYGIYELYTGASWEEAAAETWKAFKTILALFGL